MKRLPANPIDIIVGANLRRLREGRGLSQEKLAAASDITFQQVQKYERGANRISASRLVEFCRTLGCGIDQLFAGIDLSSNDLPTPSKPWVEACGRDHFRFPQGTRLRVRHRDPHPLADPNEIYEKEVTVGSIAWQDIANDLALVEYQIISEPATSGPPAGGGSPS